MNLHIFSPFILSGPGDRTRTGTVSPPRDFKSLVSTYSTTPGFRQDSLELVGLEPTKIFCKIKIYYPS